MSEKWNFQTKLDDIKNHPERHRHDYGELRACCFVDGALDLALIDAHEGILGSNGGVGCDTRSGPCSCGAWH